MSEYPEPQYVCIDDSEMDIHRVHQSPEDELIAEESRLIAVVREASTYGLLRSLRIIDNMQFEHSGIRGYIESRIQTDFAS